MDLERYKSYDKILFNYYKNKEICEKHLIFIYNVCIMYRVRLLIYFQKI